MDRKGLDTQICESRGHELTVENEVTKVFTTLSLSLPCHPGLKDLSRMMGNAGSPFLHRPSPVDLHLPSPSRNPLQYQLLIWGAHVSGDALDNITFKEEDLGLGTIGVLKPGYWEVFAGDTDGDGYYAGWGGDDEPVFTGPVDYFVGGGG